jgi:hypothetical protein
VGSVSILGKSREFAGIEGRGMPPICEPSLCCGRCGKRVRKRGGCEVETGSR